VRAKEGSVVLDKRSGQWFFYWWEAGKRRNRKIGDLRQFTNRLAAWRACSEWRQAAANNKRTTKVAKVLSVAELTEHYKRERLPERYSTRRAYLSWIGNYILPRWGDQPITAVQARPTELWIASLPLAPGSKGSLRMILSLLLDYAQWRGDMEASRNPMSLVRIKNASKRVRHARSMTVDEFQKLSERLREPFHTIALVQVCFGLRISEALALRW
jgi:integrase